MRSRRLAITSVVSGLALVVLAQRLTPIAGPPLYDGVLVISPYVWLSPPPGLEGGAQPYQQSFTVRDVGGGFGIGTTEQPPQVQLDSDLGSLVIPKGTTSMTLSITPIAVPAAQPPNGIVAGNVYRISVINQSGASIKVKAGGNVTLVMRGPTQLPEATIEQYSAGSWTQFQTSPAGIPDTFAAVLPAFGDFALVAPYAWVPTGESTPGPGGTGASQAGASSAPPPASLGATRPPGGSAAPGQDLVPIVGIAVSLLVLAGCMVALWLLRRPAKPGPDT